MRIFQNILNNYTSGLAWGKPSMTKLKFKAKRGKEKERGRVMKSGKPTTWQSYPQATSATSLFLFFGRGLSLVNPCQTLLFCTQCAKLHASRITTTPTSPAPPHCLVLTALPKKRPQGRTLLLHVSPASSPPTPSRPCASGQWPRPLSHATAIKTSWRFIILNARQTNKNNNEGGCE